jgi:nitroimidazol reductase NimA-like FMN-containing flavoprotein (pyridoxamine 5'-phosphate oxidase superfamily)
MPPTPLPPARSTAERRRDVLAHLTEDIDLWLATASADGEAHLVPLSFVWHGDRIVMSTSRASRTVANLRDRPRARAALGGLRDVVLVTGEVRIAEAADVAAGATAAFAAHVEWDPAPDPDYLWLELAPRQILAWREENELAGRTVMRGGAWVT